MNYMFFLKTLETKDSITYKVYFDLVYANT